MIVTSPQELANRSFPYYKRLVVVFGKDRATCSVVETAVDVLVHIGLENDESDTTSFTQPLSTPSNVEFASFDPNTKQTSKQKRKRNVSSTTADITNVFEKNMERASADIAKLTEAITREDEMTRLDAELEEFGLQCCRSFVKVWIPPVVEPSGKHQDMDGQKVSVTGKKRRGVTDDYVLRSMELGIQSCPEPWRHFVKMFEAWGVFLAL
ncbi:hypothetical protein Dsin_012310 [Dipteronia sinensis]|uniref:Uncharacterized protein n=1 Tax=Dipteronia sinensis TaxID=43782 RepID=A0AAE0AIN7_9ROSI|nr:hypothetical protein Dsin_012310 [Dipteronia sinensis]